MGKDNVTTISSPCISKNGHSCFSWAKEKINSVVDESQRIEMSSLKVWENYFPEYRLKGDRHPLVEICFHHFKFILFFIFILLSTAIYLFYVTYSSTIY